MIVETSEECGGELFGVLSDGSELIIPGGTFEGETSVSISVKGYFLKEEWYVGESDEVVI